MANHLMADPPWNMSCCAWKWGPLNTHDDQISILICCSAGNALRLVAKLDHEFGFRVQPGVTRH